MNRSMLPVVLLLSLSVATMMVNAFQIPIHPTRAAVVPVSKPQQRMANTKVMMTVAPITITSRLFAVIQNNAEQDETKCPVTRLTRRLRAIWIAVWKILTLPKRWSSRLLIHQNTNTMKKSSTITNSTTGTHVAIEVEEQQQQQPIITKIDETIHENNDELSTPITLMEQQSTTILDKPSIEQITSSLTSSSAVMTLDNSGLTPSVATVDLSGDWTIIVSDEFKTEYDEYLKQLGQPMLVRSIALGIIGMTTEHTDQRDNGRVLFIRGTNARGVWERSLVVNNDSNSSSSNNVTANIITTADAEQVQASAWWETNGTVHRSWLRGVTKYGGGDFESKRYLEQNGTVLVTESTFHPADSNRGTAKVTWRFLRQAGVEQKDV